MNRLPAFVSNQRLQLILTILTVLTSVSYFLPQSVKAVDGDLDLTFGGGTGFVRTFFGANPAAAEDKANALPIQSVGVNAGKIIVAGQSASMTLRWRVTIVMASWIPTPTPIRESFSAPAGR